MMEKYIPLITANCVRKILLSEIVYIMKQNRKIQIATESTVYEYYEKMERVVELLDKRFFACLRTCRINLDKIEKLENQTVFLAGGYRISLGRDNYVRTKQYYKAYLKKLL